MKIFGIGLARTGTTSLCAALEILGYKSIHSTRNILKVVKGQLTLNPKSDLLKQYDAFADNPVALVFRELDKEFPGSKFILTVRDYDSWMVSCRREFGKNVYLIYNSDRRWDRRLYKIWKMYLARKMRRRLKLAIYNCDKFSEEYFREAYDRHMKAILEYFKDRPFDLLIFNVIAQDGWGPLCNFLNKDVPKAPFPHLYARM